MQNSNVHALWQQPSVIQGFRTGVCLHGHTMYSQECLDFLPRYLNKVPGVARVVRDYETPGVHSPNGTNFARAWWTPPLTPADADQLERAQISGLDLAPLVSLTDHDTIDACVALQLTRATYAPVPVSVEWTVLFHKAILHFGIHNLPPESARSWMAAMASYTAAPQDAALPALLEALAAIPGVLVVLNHPFWLEEGIVEADRACAVEHLMRGCMAWIHALELNGTRSWRENRDTIELARAAGRPVISGGDRHACEPSACINLTNARSFAEFVAEIRDGHSTICFMPHYREPMAARILEMSWDILRPYPEYPGRENWTDRIFYKGDDDITRSLSEICKDDVPWMLKGLTAAVQLCATTKLRSAIRLLAARGQEVAF